MECDTQVMKSGCTTHASSESSSSWNSKRPRPTLSIGGGDRQHLKLNPNPSNPPKRRKLVRPTFDKPSPSCNADDKGVSRNDGLFQMAAASVPTIPDLTVTLDRGGGDQHAEASSKGGLRNDGLRMAASVPDLASFNCNNKGGFRDGAPQMNMVVTAAPQDTIIPDQQVASVLGHKDKGSRDDALHPPVPDAVPPTPDTNTIILPPEQQQPLLVSTHHCDIKLRGDPVPMAAADATPSDEEIAPLLVQHNTAIEELRSCAILSMRAVGVGVPSTCAPLSPEPEPETETLRDAQRHSCIISQPDQQFSDDLTRAIVEEYAARFPPLLFDDEDDLMVSNIDSDSDSDDDDAFIQRLHAMFHTTSS